MRKKRIMFVMLKTLGDVAVCTTIVRELKKEFQNSEIYFFTNRAYAPLLENNPDIHEVKVSQEWLPDMIFMEMASGFYDLCFAPYQCRRECNVWHQEEATRHQHLVDFYWKRMGMHRPITERECYIFPSKNDFLEAEKHISFDSPRIAIHSTTGVATKDWPHFEMLAEELRKLGYAACQVGTMTDKKVSGAIDFRGKMSLLELAAFLSRSAAFVGLDSGISYIADAMKVPSIIIQGSTNPVTSGPISDRVVHLFAKKTGYQDCEVIRCHANCRHENNCINEISVGDVLEKLEVVLEAWRSPLPVRVD